MAEALGTGNPTSSVNMQYYLALLHSPSALHCFFCFIFLSPFPSIISWKVERFCYAYFFIERKNPLCFTQSGEFIGTSNVDQIPVFFEALEPPSSPIQTRTRLALESRSSPASTAHGLRTKTHIVHHRRSGFFSPCPEDKTDILFSTSLYNNMIVL